MQPCAFENRDRKLEPCNILRTWQTNYHHWCNTSFTFTLLSFDLCPWKWFNWSICTRPQSLEVCKVSHENGFYLMGRRERGKSLAGFYLFFSFWWNVALYTAQLNLSPSFVMVDICITLKGYILQVQDKLQMSVSFLVKFWCFQMFSLPSGQKNVVITLILPWKQGFYKLDWGRLKVILTLIWNQCFSSSCWSSNFIRWILNHMLCVLIL